MAFWAGFEKRADAVAYNGENENLINPGSLGPGGYDRPNLRAGLGAGAVGVLGGIAGGAAGHVASNAFLGGARRDLASALAHGRHGPVHIEGAQKALARLHGGRNKGALLGALLGAAGVGIPAFVALRQRLMGQAAPVDALPAQAVEQPMLDPALLGAGLEA